MSARLSELALKKRMLQQRSAVLRHTFALQVHTKIAPMAGMADRALSTGRWLGRHPYWLVAASVALAVCALKVCRVWPGVACGCGRLGSACSRW